MFRIILMVIKSIFQIPFWWHHLDKINKNSSIDITTKYNYVRKLIQLINKRGRVKIISTGIEYLPKTSGYVLYPNHQGLFDALGIIQSHPTPIAAISKIELKDVIFIKQVFESIGAKYMDRGDIRSSMKVLTQVTNEVKTGRNYIIFPEGTRSKNQNTLGEFKGGSFKASINSKAPIVPVAIIDSYKVFDINSVKTTTVQIHYLKPLYYEDYKDLKSIEIASLVSSQIQTFIHEKLS